MSEPSFRRSPDFLVRDVGGRHVLVPVRRPMPRDVAMFLLEGPVARLLWEALAAPRSRAELVEEVLAGFEVDDPERVGAEVDGFLEQLGALGALEPLQGGSP